MKALCLFALTVTLAASAATNLDAREPGSEVSTLRAQCSSDYLRLCAGVDLNRKAIEACFRKNIREVSLGCRVAVTSYKTADANNRRLLR